MSDIVESCPLTKLNGDLSRLHCADEDAVSWLTSHQLWFMTRIREEEEEDCMLSTHLCVVMLLNGRDYRDVITSIVYRL